MGTTTYIHEKDKFKLLSTTINYICNNMHVLGADFPQFQIEMTTARRMYERGTRASHDETLKHARMAIDSWNFSEKFRSFENKNLSNYVKLLRQIIDLFHQHLVDVWTLEGVDSDRTPRYIYNTPRGAHREHAHPTTTPHAPREPGPTDVESDKTYTSREDKKKLMVDLISSVHSLCKHAALQMSRHAECKEFMRAMEGIYEKVLRTSPSGSTGLNYALNEQLTTEVRDSLNESYGKFLECRQFLSPKLKSGVIFLNTVMIRMDDGKEWRVVMRDGCWWMRDRDGVMQQITVESPMLEVAYTSVDEKYSFESGTEAAVRCVSALLLELHDLSERDI